MALSTNHIFYASLAGLAITMLYLFVQMKRVRSEIERTHQQLETKCNRLNTMIQSGLQNNEEVSYCEGEVITDHNELPETLTVESDLKREIDALEQKELEEEAIEHQEADRELESLEENVESHLETTTEEEPKKGLFSDIPFELELNYEKNFAAMEDEPVEEEAEAEAQPVEEEAEAEAQSVEEEAEAEAQSVEEEAEAEPVEEEAVDIETPINYYDMTVKELKQIASDMNLRVGGTKPELVERIQNANQK
jgi:uncharacterized membrane protein YqiK